MGLKTPGVVIERPYRAAFREVTLTERRADTVVCRTVMSGISTGTDLKTYRGLQHPEKCFYPLVPGYENMGIVVEGGAYAPELHPGDRVMINECCQYLDCCSAWGGNTLLVHKDSLTGAVAGGPLCRVPDEVSDRDAVLAYLACVAQKGVDRFSLKPGEWVLVFGAGLVGLSAMQLLKIACPEVRVAAVEPSAARRAIAVHYADAVLPFDGTTLDLVRDLTGGRLADKILECSGNPVVPGQLYAYLKDGGWGDGDEPGHIHLNGDYPDRLIFDHHHRWFVKNAMLTMSCAMRSTDKARVLGCLADGRFDTSRLPVEVWPAGKAAEAFAYLDKNEPEVLKILFDWRDC